MSPGRYSDRVPDSEVLYSGPTMDADGVLGQPRYSRASDRALVVWVNAANQESIAITGGFFALYEGSESEYTPTITEGS